MGERLIAVPRTEAHALAWLRHLGLDAAPLPEEAGRVAKAALFAALRPETALPEGFAFRGDRGRVGRYLWEFLTAFRTSEAEVRARFAAGTRFVAFFDFVPTVFAGRRSGDLPEGPTWT